MSSAYYMLQESEDLAIDMSSNDLICNTNSLEEYDEPNEISNDLDKFCLNDDLEEGDEDNEVSVLEESTFDDDTDDDYDDDEVYEYDDDV